MACDSGADASTFVLKAREGEPGHVFGLGTTMFNYSGAHSSSAIIGSSAAICVCIGPASYILGLFSLVSALLISDTSSQSVKPLLDTYKAQLTLSVVVWTVLVDNLCWNREVWVAELPIGNFQKTEGRGLR
ncbi:hypothetical protein C8R44DRAFT_745041 [Mycena epipterygia]|nr:hypothetical protein C8R44DRAFT_745041 [Mycena epipterygia]